MGVIGDSVKDLSSNKIMVSLKVTPNW